MQTKTSLSRCRSWFGVGAAIGLGIVAGTFIAAFSVGCRSSWHRPLPSSEPAGHAPSSNLDETSRDAGARHVPDASATARSTTQVAAVEPAAMLDAGAKVEASAGAASIPIRRRPARRVDLQRVEHGQPLPRDYVE